jgi:transcriptional regulator with XRE-family HTH domain
MGGFSERLKRASSRLKVEWGQTSLGAFLGVSKQTAERWMGEGQPASDRLFDIADRLGVDARWLATGSGDMLPKPSSSDLTAMEAQLMDQYRRADPRWQLSIRLLSGLAVEDQLEAATDVNVVIARVLGMKPKDLRYPTDREVARKLGKAPHVIAREKEGKK